MTGPCHKAGMWQSWRSLQVCFEPKLLFWGVPLCRLSVLKAQKAEDCYLSRNTNETGSCCTETLATPIQQSVGLWRGTVRKPLPQGGRISPWRTRVPGPPEAGQRLYPEACNPTHETMSPRQREQTDLIPSETPMGMEAKGSVFEFKNQKSQVGLFQLPR